MSNNCNGMLIEGWSENLIKSSDYITNMIIESGFNYCLLAESEIGFTETWEVTIPENGCLSLKLNIDFCSGTNALNLSCFGWSKENKTSIEISLNVPGHSICKTFSLTENARQRYKVVLETPQTSTLANATIKLINNNQSPAKISLAIPCVEYGAFASSPIPPGNVRNTESVSLNLKSLTKSGGIFITLLSLLDHYEWYSSSNGIIFGAYSECGKFGVDIFIGATDGLIGISITNLGNRKEIHSKTKILKDVVFGFSILWSDLYVKLYIDGCFVICLDFPGIQFNFLNKINVGCHPLKDGHSSNIILRDIQFFDISIMEHEVCAVLASMDPERYWYYVPILNKSIEANKNKWPKEIINILLRMPSRWQSMPPIWATNGSVDEGIFRDDVANILELQNIIAVPEAKCSSGRTDLLTKSENGSRIRIEFKVWGRHDYLSVPEKPIKYMTEEEDIGVVIMLNNNKKLIDNIYMKSVITGKINCINWIENPFSSTKFPFHFISKHDLSGKRISILHIVFNINKPFSMENNEEFYSS